MASPTNQLRYRISSWGQLSKCMSNNSRQLHIVVSEFLQSSRLSGTRIRIDHDDFGTLFACVLNGQGSLLSPDTSVATFQLSTDQILSELAKYGFIVEYAPAYGLPGSQVEYLMTLQSLHFDKIRVLNVWDYQNSVKHFDTYVVAFQVASHGDWMNAGYSPSVKEFLSALNDGTAINISAISKDRRYDWSWLVGWVGSINDILTDCAEAESCQ